MLSVRDMKHAWNSHITMLFCLLPQQTIQCQNFENLKIESNPKIFLCIPRLNPPPQLLSQPSNWNLQYQRMLNESSNLSGELFLKKKIDMDIFLHYYAKFDPHLYPSLSSRIMIWRNLNHHYLRIFSISNNLSGNWFLTRRF